MKTETITMDPMPPLEVGAYFTGWKHTYKVLRITSATTAIVRRAYWWERLRFWISDNWFMLKLDVRRWYQRLNGGPRT